MEAGQRHANALECLQLNVKVPELAVMDRHRKQSWSVVVGGTDSRSVDTGLNELDRVIGMCVSIFMCILCVCVYL